MIEFCNGTHLFEKGSALSCHQLRMQHLDRNLRVLLELFSQVYDSGTSLTQLPQKAIIANLLTSTIIRVRTLHKLTLFKNLI
jgi:hypothetical protein